MKHNSLELLIQTLVKNRGRKSLPKKLVQRLIFLIEQKLEPGCCDPEAVVIDTPFHSPYEIMVKQILLSLPNKGNIESLNKSLRILRKNIGDPCCD